VSICIIFNPTARGEKAKKFQRSLEASRGRFALKPTHCAGAARQLATQAIEEGFQTIVAAGGDGTLNEVLNGIADAPDGFSRARLGVMPLGTINVFARELRVPLKLSDVWPMLEAGHEIALDVGCAEFQNQGRPQKRLFLQLAGAGIDARSVELVSWELKKKLGKFAYLAAAFRALSDSSPRITIDNGATQASGALVLIGNGKFYGGSYPLLHKSELQDGLLDAAVFDQVNWQALPGIGWNFLLGRLFKEGCTAYLQGREMTLRSDGRAAFQVDGEFAGELPGTISVWPRRLRVVVPQPA
jgi:diacylglycerol kinase (ATP)